MHFRSLLKEKNCLNLPSMVKLFVLLGLWGFWVPLDHPNQLNQLGQYERPANFLRLVQVVFFRREKSIVESDVL